MKLFGKLKGLFPVFVIAGAVVITIKLLTTQTPENIEILKVNAEEDIKKEDYKDVIEEPPAPEPSAQEEVPKEDEPTSEEENQQEEDNNEDEGEEETPVEEQVPEESEEKKKEEKEKEPPAAKKLKLTDHPVAKIIGSLINKKQ